VTHKSLKQLQDEAHRIAVEHGWWEPQEVNRADISAYTQTDDNTIKVQRSFGDQIALMHSELSEALEAYRERGLEKWAICSEHGGGPELCPNSNDCKDKQKPEGAFVELADCIIRILNTAGHYGVDMQALVEEKMAFNETRPYRHGKRL
jgi:hypothetical protein